MSENRLPIDDPRLTAYALGELDPAGCAEVERLLEDSPECRAAIAEIRELAGLLSSGLGAEPAPSLSESQRGQFVRSANSAERIVPAAAAIVAPSTIPKPAASQFARRFASIAMIAAMLMVALLVVPARKSAPLPGVDRDFDVAGSRVAEDLPSVDPAKLRQEAKNAMFRAERIAQKNPAGALALIAKAESQVRSSSLDGTTQEELLRDLTRSRDNLSQSARLKEPSPENARRSKEIEAMILNEGAIKVLNDTRFAYDVVKFNELMDAKRFDEAEVIADQVRKADPDHPLGEVMSLKSKLAAQGGRESKADAFTKELNDIDKAAATYTTEVEYSDVKKWKDLTVRRNRSAEQSAGIAGTPLKSHDIKGNQKGKADQPIAGNGSSPRARLSERRTGKGKPAKAAEGAPHAGQVIAGKPGQNATPLHLHYEAKSQAEEQRPDYLTRRGPALTPLSASSKGNSDGQADSATPLPALGVEVKTVNGQTTLARFGDAEEGRIAAEQDLRRRLSERLKGPAAEAELLGKIERQLRDGLERDALGRNDRYFFPLERKDADSDDVVQFEVYEPIVENPFVTPTAEPLSTFGIDVDTASYANVRRFLTNRQMPPRNAVRIEELINYFRYDDPQPADGRPFSVNVEVGNAPWRPQHRLVRIGLKGREIPRDKRPTSNLVFLVDVSGSMSSENKLPLVKAGLSLLTEQMTESDRVAIVTYSDTAALRLDSTNGTDRKPILDTIASLQANGSTNGAGGIQLAYETAVRHFIEGGTNRVILCTDGDFNVGVSDDEQLVQLIQERARTKVFFSVFGFGMGNLKDGKLEKLADKGNGHYAYIDGQREAKKVFVDELSGTLVTIAKDVKLQVEFNPARVGAYRLIGYENRALASQDFHNDKKDAGDIGAGHSVTALYEIAPVNETPKPAAEGLRYQRVGVAKEGGLDDELLTVKLRYKQPEAESSELFEVPVADPGRAANGTGTITPVSHPSHDLQWSSAVAAFGMVLRDSQYRGQAGLDLVLELAQGAKGEDKQGLRQEFIDLVRTVKSMRPDLSTAHIAPPIPPVAPGASTELTKEQAERGATVDGKYKNLLRIIPAPGDAAEYGPFRDYGRWEGTSYLGHENLPQGYWVYVAPDWYIWGDATKADERK